MNINITKIDTLNNYCIDLLSLAERLEENESNKELYNLTEEILKSIRKLVIASVIYNKRVICISGMQGAGKTTLIKNFYGLDDKYLNVSLGRGERIPVFITEKNIEKPCAFAIRIEKDDEGKYVQKNVELQPEDFVEASKGKDSDIMCLELCVPYKYIYNDSVSFMLLPGFEGKGDYWNNLIEFSVNSSDAAVFVFNETSFSNATNEKYLTTIEETFGSNMVYVITGADGSRDDNEEVKETCIKTLGILAEEKDRVVCTGVYSDQNKNEKWINCLINSLEKYAFKDAGHVYNNNHYIYKELENIEEKFSIILRLINENSSTESKIYENNRILKTFDRAYEKRKKILKDNLKREIENGKNESIQNLEKLFSNRPKLPSLKRMFLGSNVKESFTETREMIKKSFIDSKGNDISKRCLSVFYNDSFNSLTEDSCTSSINFLLDTKKVGDKEVLDVAGDNTKKLMTDIQTLLSDDSSEQVAIIESKNARKLMDALAEFSTVYFECEAWKQLENKTETSCFEPAQMESIGEEIAKGTKASQKVLLGLAGTVAVDVIDDGVINMAEKVAAALSVSSSVGAGIVIGASALGGAVAMIRDLNRLQRTDFDAARRTVIDIYEGLKDEILDLYGEYMKRIRERIENNIEELSGVNRNVIAEYNAKITISNARNLLSDMLEEYRQEEYGIKSALH